MLTLLRDLCIKLESVEIPYMLSGSMAMNIYTVPRMTRDIDIVIQLGLTDIERFAGLFVDGFYIYKEGVEFEIKRQGMFNVIDYESGVKIDFIIQKNTDFHINEFNRRVRSKAFGFDVWVVSAEDLIISKLKWIQDIESDTQKRDISNLLNKENLDKEYIMGWCKKLNLKTYNLFIE
jgi:hypothetical protein